MGAQSYPYTVTEEPRDLPDDDLCFISEYTGEKDLDKLRAHVVAVWRSVKDKAWVYKCIQEFMFLKPRISLHQHYPEVQALIKSGQPFHILDLGTCFGQDTRKLLLDGAPEDSITVTDITPDYWEFGKRLFMDGAKLEGGGHGGGGGVEALFGSFTDPAFVSRDSPVGPLGRLAGQVSVAWAGAVLHVLSKEDVRAFAAHAHLVLAPGGAWIGTCAGRTKPGEWAQTPNGKGMRYLHSTDSLAALMREVGFAVADVRETALTNYGHAQDPLMTDDQMVLLQYTAIKK